MVASLPARQAFFLAELSRRPSVLPQISAGWKAVVKLADKLASALNASNTSLLALSHNAIARVLRQHQLVPPRKKKPTTKKQLRSVKRHWKLFGQLSTDTKYLQDSPHYGCR